MSGLDGWHYLAAAAAGTSTQHRPCPPSHGSQQQHLSTEEPFPALVEALDQVESEERAAELQSLLLGVSFEDIGGGASDTDDENTHAAEAPPSRGRARCSYGRRRDVDSSTLTGQCSRELSHFAVDEISSDDDDHQDGDYGADSHDDSHDAVGPEDPCELNAPGGDDAHMASAEDSLSLLSEPLFTLPSADGASSSRGGAEGNSRQTHIYVHHEPSVDALIPQRLPSNLAEGQAVYSQVCVTLRTSEVQRRHLALQVQALKNEQARLVGQLQGLAKHERELEEHVLLLSQAVAGARGGGQMSTLQLLRGQMLDAARGEVERVRGEMQEAMKAREKAAEEMEERGREAAAVAEALRTEVGRLAEQLAQRTVVHSAHEREAKDRGARMERQAEKIEALEQQMETLRAELDEGERHRLAAEEGRSAAEAHAESEREVARGLEERLGAMEVDLAEARNHVRDLEAGLEAERRAGGGREAEGRYAAEVDRITQGFHMERSKLEAENEALRQEVARVGVACHYAGVPDVGGDGRDGSGGGDMGPEMSPHPARRQDDEPEGPPADAEPMNDMSQFIEDGAESIDGRSEAASVWRGRCERAENECRALRAALHDVQCRVDAETKGAPEQAGGGGDASTVVERLVLERQRMADAFKEELSGVLAGARRAFEQEKAAEIEEMVREYEAEKLRAERARTRAVEECRVRWEEEREMLVQQWKGRIADVEEGAVMMVERRMQQVRAEMEVELRRAVDKVQSEASEDAKRLQAELTQTSQEARKSVEDVREELASAVREAHRLKGELTEATARKDELESMLQDLQSTHAEQIKQILAARETELHDALARVKHEEAARIHHENEVTAMKAMLEASGSRDSVAPAKEQGSVTPDDQQAEITRLMDEKKKILAAFEEQMKRLLGEARDAMERERREGVKEGRREAAERLSELTAALEDSRAAVEALRIRLKDRVQFSEAGAEVDDESMRLRQEVDTLRAVLRDADSHAAELEMARARSEDTFRSEVVRLKEEHKAEVGRLRQVLRAEAEQTVARALAQAHEAFSKEKENLLGTAEEEWKERLADISRKTRLLQGAVVRMGQKARDKEAAAEAVRRELSEARAMVEAQHATHLEEVEKMQKDAQVREKRMKDLEKVIHKLRKHGGEKGQQREKENQEKAQLVLRTELEAQERRLRLDFQHQLQEAIARSRADRDQEVEVVMSAMRKRYKGKLAKLQAQWAKERDALLAATDAVATTKLAYKPLALYNRQQPSALRTMNY